MTVEVITIGGITYQAPFADLMRRLTEREYGNLKKDIANRGVVVPIIIDENGNILDGYHRAKIAQELVITNFVAEIRAGLSDEEKTAIARDLNEHRRHLTPDEITELARQGRENGKSHRQIASELDGSLSTIYRAGVSFETPASKNVNGKDGKTYPATKPSNEEVATRRLRARELKAAGYTGTQIAKELGVSKRTVGDDLKAINQTSIITKSRQEEQKTRQIFETVSGNELPKKPLDSKRAQRKGREIDNKNRRENTAPQVFTNSGVDIRLGDFRQVLADIESESIDLILTDPPYHEKYLDLWDGLAELAARVLKPGALLVAYSGQYHLLTIMNKLAGRLNYVWQGSLKMTGPEKNIVQQRRIYNRAKPLLFFCKGDYKPEAWIDDFFADDRPEKDSHEWQQGIAPAVYYIGALTKPGAKVLDPFLGSGTAAEAAVKLGRSFIGAEIDPAYYQKSIERVNERT